MIMVADQNGDLLFEFQKLDKQRKSAKKLAFASAN
jgi:hypothetical protein